MAFRFEPRHFGERLAIVPHRFVSSAIAASSRITQDESTVFRVSAGLVTAQADAFSEPGPDLLDEKTFDGGRTAWPVVRR